MINAKDANAAIEELAGMSMASDKINPPIEKVNPQIDEPKIIALKLLA